MGNLYLRDVKRQRAWTVFSLGIVIALVAVTFYLTAVYGGAHMVFNCVLGVFALVLNLYLLFAMSREIKKCESEMNHG